MKVNLSLKLKVLSFEGFSTKSLVYDEIFKQLGKIERADNTFLGDKLVCPNDEIVLTVELSK